MQNKFIIISFLIIISVAKNYTDEDPNHTDVVVSRAATLNRLQNVEVFEEMENLFFFIPDVPEPPRLTAMKCTTGMDPTLCAIFTNSKAVMNDLLKSIKIINRVLTTKGLREEQLYEPDTVSPGWFDLIQGVDVKSDSPTQELQDAVGDEYMTQLETRLALRKILDVGTGSLTTKEKRLAISTLGPAISLVRKIVDPIEVVKYFSGLFTGDNGILKALTAYRAASPEDKKAFSDLSNKVSEFESESRKLFIDVLQRTGDLEKNLTNLQNDKHYFKLSIAGLKEYVLMQQTLVADLMRILFVANVYTMHFVAFGECQANSVSPIFLPPSLLAERLKELEKKLPADIELIYGSADVAKFYTMKTASCMFDSRGGLLKLGVPIKRRKASYQLYEYKPIQFGFHDYTCSLETPATYVIKDIYNNDIYPINELDINTCRVETGLCQLPMTNEMDTGSVCINILLKGLPADKVKENCPLKCTKRRQPSITKIAQDVFVGVHLPSTGITIKCPDDVVIPLNTKVDIGSTQINLECTFCNIYWNNRLVGESTSIPCNDIKKPTIQTLLPLHFSNLKDLKPFVNDGAEKTIFASMDDILNENYNPEKVTSTSPPIQSNSNAFWHYGGLVLDTLQTLALCWFYYNNNYLRLPGAAMIPNYFGLAQAARDAPCKIPTDIYVLLYTIIILILCFMIPFIVKEVCKFAKRTWNRTVDIAAWRQQNEMLDVGSTAP